MSEKVFENDQVAVYVSGGLVQVENKASQLWGRVWVDGPTLSFTCRSCTMSLVTVRGDAVVCCYNEGKHAIEFTEPIQERICMRSGNG